MNVQIEESWKTHLQPEFDKDYFRTLTEFVRSEYSQYQIFPPGRLIFNAFNLCPFDKVKVVIIGQDPYHGPGQAHGLCFSVNDGVQFPPSLVNIFKEIKADIGTDANPLGRTRCTAAQRNTDCTCTPSRFSSKPRLGDIYRRRYSCPGRKQGAPGVYLMGLVRSKEGSFH